MNLAAIYAGILQNLKEETLSFYGERLISLVVFGSVASGAQCADSDIDILIVADPLPDGRMKRIREFDIVELRLASVLKGARRAGVNTMLSPIFKTPIELKRGTPLMLDMTLDVIVLHDENTFFDCELKRLSVRLSELGAKRIEKGNQWYWDLKPDFKFGEVFAI